MQPNQQVDFLSDGGEDVRNLQLYLNPQAETPAGLVSSDDAIDSIEPDCQGTAGERR
jgi:hypothetical protein